MTAPHGTADDYEKAQAKEWQRFRARVPIDFYGQRAYNTGDPVPVSAVEGQVAWIDRQWVDEADPYTGSATVPPAEPPTIDPATVAAPAGAAAEPPPPEDDGSTVTSSEG